MTNAELIDLVQPMLPDYQHGNWIGENAMAESVLECQWWYAAAEALAKRLADAEAYVKEYYRQAKDALAAQSRAESERMEMFAALVELRLWIVTLKCDDVEKASALRLIDDALLGADRCDRMVDFVRRNP